MSPETEHEVTILVPRAAFPYRPAKAGAQRTSDSGKTCFDYIGLNLTKGIQSDQPFQTPCNGWILKQMI